MLTAMMAAASAQATTKVNVSILDPKVAVRIGAETHPLYYYCRNEKLTVYCCGGKTSVLHDVFRHIEETRFAFKRNLEHKAAVI
jgi:membrane-bound inhibitor of C-type lysozyme